MAGRPRKSIRKVKTSQLTNHRIQVIAGAALAALIVFGLVIPLTAMQYENQNSFCASCHTEGELTFFNRAVVTAPVDLASIHDIQGQARCIDCHTGPGLIGRYGGLMAGASDLISYFSGHYPQPAVQDTPIRDGNCLKCHQNVTASQDFNNHFHAFLSRWQSFDPNAAHCVDCHVSHDPTNDAGTVFLNRNITIQICQRCHAASGRG
jgi:hypothetical protein